MARGEHPRLFPIERVKAVVTAGRPGAQAHGPSDMPVWGPIFKSLDASDTIAQARIDSVRRLGPYRESCCAA
jgi:hypothetical protein